MAKVVCTVDTEDKSVECTVDGEAVANFGYLSVYGDKSMYGFMLSMASVEELDDLTKTTHWSHSSHSDIADELEAFLLSQSK